MILENGGLWFLVKALTDQETQKVLIGIDPKFSYVVYSKYAEVYYKLLFFVQLAVIE